MTEVTNRVKDPWPIRLKPTVNCTGALAVDAKYYTYTLTDPTQNGTIECYNGNGTPGFVYYARFTCADKAKVSLAWCNIIESKADWIAGTCQRESLMRVVMASGCPPCKLHHVGIYTMDDWQHLRELHDKGELVEPWFAPPINDPGYGHVTTYQQRGEVNQGN